jgi:hypothetical protein
MEPPGAASPSVRVESIAFAELIAAPFIRPQPISCFAMVWSFNFEVLS